MRKPKTSLVKKSLGIREFRRQQKQKELDAVTQAFGADLAQQNTRLKIDLDSRRALTKGRDPLSPSSDYDPAFDPNYKEDDE